MPERSPVTCLQVQVAVRPDDPGRVVAQRHEHRLGQSLVPVPLPPDGHFPTSESSVRFLFDLPEKGACGNRDSSHDPKNIGNFTQKNFILGATGGRFLTHPLASAPVEKSPQHPGLKPWPPPARPLCSFGCHVARILICETGRGRLCSTESSDRLRRDRVGAPHGHSPHGAEAGPARSGGRDEHPYQHREAQLAS